MLRKAKQDDLRAFVGLLVILVEIAVGPFASAAAVFHYSRKIKKYSHFTYIDFSETGLSLENTHPDLACFFQYANTRFTLGIRTYIRRGNKGAAHRSIDRISLTFLNKENGPVTLEQVGAMAFIRQMLDVDPRFQSFSSEVRPRNPYNTDEDEKDLAQYVKDQIHNYLTYGRMLRYSKSQRNEVRWVGYMLMGVGVFFILYEWNFLVSQWPKEDGAFPLAAALVLFPIVFFVFGLGARMWYLAHKDERLEKEIKNLPRG